MSERIGNLIRRLRKEKGLTQRRLAELIGTNFTYMSKLETGRLGTTPTIKTLVAIADALKVDRDWLLTECGRPPERLKRSIAENPEFFQRIGKLRGRQLDKVLKQPYQLAGQVPAGPTMEAIEDAEDFDVTDLFAPGEHYVLRVRGDSMIEDGIHDGDMAIIRPQPECENGDVVIAFVNGNEATLKRFFRKGNQVRLQPANERMEPLVVDADRVEIRGKVVGIIRPHV